MLETVLSIMISGHQLRISALLYSKVNSKRVAKNTLKLIIKKSWKKRRK